METNLTLEKEFIISQKTFFEALLNKNASFMNENLHEDFIFTSPRAVILNKEGFIQNFCFNLNLTFEVFQSSDENAIIIDSTSILYCLVQVKISEQTEFWERITFALIKKDDKWLTLTMTATFVP